MLLDHKRHPRIAPICVWPLAGSSAHRPLSDNPVASPRIRREQYARLIRSGPVYPATSKQRCESRPATSTQSQATTRSRIWLRLLWSRWLAFHSALRRLSEQAALSSYAARRQHSIEFLRRLPRSAHRLRQPFSFQNPPAAEKQMLDEYGSQRILAEQPCRGSQSQQLPPYFFLPSHPGGRLSSCQR